MKISTLAFAFLFLTTKTIGQSIIWSQTDPGKIIQSDIDGNNRTTLLAESAVRYHILDTANAKLYWSDYGQNKVFYSDLDGANSKELISNLIRPAGLCIHDNSLFLVDDKKIKRYDLNGVFQETIHTGLTNPSDIIIYQSKIYWGDLGDKTIKSSLLDGTQIQTLVSNAYSVVDLDINHLTNKLFWAQAASSAMYWGIYRSNLDGSNLETVANEPANGMTLDAENNKAYWSESILNNVFSVNLDDFTTSSALFSDNLTHPTAISINKSTGKIYVSNKEGGAIIFQGKLSSVYIKPIIFTAVSNPKSFTIDTTNAKIYWINGKNWQGSDQSAGILRANLDGSNVQKLLKWPDVKNPTGITIDVAANKMFWTDYNKKSIFSSDLDGNNISEILSNIIYPKGIYVHNNQIYWISDNHSIHRANYDGSNITELVNNLSYPQEISISTSVNKIFWTESSGTLSKANLDGSDVQVIASAANANSLFLDEYHQQIYATSRKYHNSFIFKAHYDSLGIQKITDEDLGTVEHITLLNPESIVSIPNFPSSESQISIAPNPFQADFKILSNKELIRSISIYNSLGVEIFQAPSILKSSYSTNVLKNNPAGIYWIRVEDVFNNFEIKKLVKN